MEFDLRNKLVIGMIHLAGFNKSERMARALVEMTIYQEEGVDAVIIEDYHGTARDVYHFLELTERANYNIIRGVNVLSNPYSAFELAKKFNVKFIQIDSVQTPDLNLPLYDKLRITHPSVLVFGGVGFKYTNPTGRPLEQDLQEAMERCDAIVTTGEGTGIETPIEKLRQYKRILGDFPLIVGAGVTPRNVYEQLKICDGAIVGSYFKQNSNTHLPVDRSRVRELMDLVREVRTNVIL